MLYMQLVHFTRVYVRYVRINAGILEVLKDESTELLYPKRRACARYIHSRYKEKTMDFRSYFTPKKCACAPVMFTADFLKLCTVNLLPKVLPHT